jgi:hypothetical protein
LYEGLSETANKDKELFDEHFWNENKKGKHRFINARLCIPSGIPGTPRNPQESGFKKIGSMLVCRNL